METALGAMETVRGALGAMETARGALVAMETVRLAQGAMETARVALAAMETAIPPSQATPPASGEVGELQLQFCPRGPPYQASHILART